MQERKLKALFQHARDHSPFYKKHFQEANITIVKKIMKGLSTIKDFKGLVGPVAFDADGDADKPIFVAEIKDGRWFINK